MNRLSLSNQSTQPTGSISSILNEAASMLNAGQTGEAERLCRAVLKRLPKEPNALRLMGMIKLQRGKPEAAERLVRKAIKIAPKSAHAFMDLGMVLTSRNRPGPAIDAFRKATRLDPHYIDAWYNLGKCLQTAERNEEAAKALAKAIELNPEHRKAFTDLGHSFGMEGKKSQAAQAFRRGIESQPDRAQYYFNLVNLKEIGLTDKEISFLEENLERKKFTGMDEIYACFALAKSYEDRRDFDRAFTYLRRGNDLKHAKSGFDIRVLIKAADSIIGSVNRELLDRLEGGGAKSNAPIFILSLPRSGSTLTEQILASHSLVTGGDEMGHTGAIMMHLNGTDERLVESLATISKKQLRELAESLYLSQTRQLTNKTPFFTDKSLNNFTMAGLLHLLMPNAKFVRVRRDPMDTCLSNYRQLFMRGQEFSYNLTALAQYYRLHDRFMEHWNALLPGRIYELRYEQLVANQEAETRRLLDFLELPFEANCLKFYQTKRTVKTVSTAQVRKPMNKSAVERWRKYEAHLQPLIEALEKPLPQL